MSFSFTIHNSPFTNIFDPSFEADKVFVGQGVKDL